ncbi:MAG: stage sporulation protein [Phycisphaerales bacterium]|nr:stage sporulation protein [Phycisphaerales bacterium]
MQCMEVWGGNQPADAGVVMAGLDAWVYCRPFVAKDDSPQEIGGGGDVYYVSSCATGRITRLLVADVSGHGSAVRDVAGSLRTLMRKYVNYLDPSRFVGEMNQNFTALSEAGCFATAVVTTFFSPTNHITLCNAGHPPPLIYRSAERRWSYVREQCPEDESVADLPLGIEDATDYRFFDVRLNVGDLVLCYTDGLPESRGQDGDYLGLEGLLQVVQKIDISDPTAVVPKLLAAIADLYPHNLSADDITVLLFRPNGLAPVVPIRDRLLAPLRLLGGILSALRPGGGPIPWPDNHPANVGGAFLSRFNHLWSGRANAAAVRTLRGGG